MVVYPQAVRLLGGHVGADDDAQSAWRMPRAPVNWLRAALSILARWWLWVILAVAFVVGIIFILQPSLGSPEAAADDVATAWDEGIVRLGLMPLFPPAEDFYVGDLWAVIADVQIPIVDQSSDQSAPLEAYRLRGKSVRIAHIDLRSEIEAARDGQPVFPNTVDSKVDPNASQNLVELDDLSPSNKISLTLAAYPGVTVYHRRRATTSLGWGFGALGLGRQDQQFEQISIPIAETYGAPVGAAFNRLDMWCADPKTKIFCSEDYVRRILAYAINGNISHKTNGNYDTRIVLQFIYRVFMTREIDHSNVVGGGLSANLQVNSKAATPSLAAANTATPAAQPIDSSMPASNSTVVFTNSTQIGLNEIFPRPLVFGFRAITVDLTPSTP